ncbi:cAMP-binding domain of CRP or a regulatory subunit of cAMP-dependent protein kinases [Variovorax sp. YR216]|nr:cAMP-binding domain of CRP or a regulatory subunit of cAMP-dependent protein kinases [Variovorax sp. YR216]
MTTEPVLLHGIRAALTSNPWFARLPEPVRADVVSRVRVRMLSEGEWAFCREEMPDGVYAVLEGILRVSSVTLDGRETLLDFYGSGTWCGEVALLAGQRRFFGAQACGNAVLAHVPAADFEALMAKWPVFSRALLQLEAERLSLVLGALETYSSRTTKQRLAMRLLLLARDHGLEVERGIAIGLELSHETLARLTGSTRQRVNNILNAWKRAGLVEHHYGRVLLLDKAAVEKIAQL